MDTERPHPSAWESDQWKKEQALDRILFSVSVMSFIMITLVFLDTPAGFLYYFQDGITRKYLAGFSRVDRYAYHVDSWHLVVMMVGAYGLLHHIPASYDAWLKQKKIDERSNPLFRYPAYGMVLLISFILHLTWTPHGFTDPTILHLYRAVTIGLVLLTVLINHMAVYWIFKKKTCDYYGVDDRFSKGIVSVYILSIMATTVMESLVLPWLCL